MNWQSVTFNWNRARAFLVTAEEGSLSAAARALGLTQPTLGRQVSENLTSIYIRPATEFDQVSAECAGSTSR